MALKLVKGSLQYKNQIIEIFRRKVWIEIAIFFLEIKWTINDIQELLKANNCDYSDEAIENF